MVHTPVLYLKLAVFSLQLVNFLSQFNVFLSTVATTSTFIVITLPHTFQRKKKDKSRYPTAKGSVAETELVTSDERKQTCLQALLHCRTSMCSSVSRFPSWPPRISSGGLADPCLLPEWPPSEARSCPAVPAELHLLARLFDIWKTQQIPWSHNKHNQVHNPRTEHFTHKLEKTEIYLDCKSASESSGSLPNGRALSAA